MDITEVMHSIACTVCRIIKVFLILVSHPNNRSGGVFFIVAYLGSKMEDGNVSDHISHNYLFLYSRIQISYGKKLFELRSNLQEVCKADVMYHDTVCH
jgi:hypothetical protein